MTAVPVHILGGADDDGEPQVRSVVVALDGAAGSSAELVPVGARMSRASKAGAEATAERAKSAGRRARAKSEEARAKTEEAAAKAAEAAAKARAQVEKARAKTEEAAAKAAEAAAKARAQVEKARAKTEEAAFEGVRATRRQARLVAARAATARREAEEAAGRAKVAQQKAVKEARKAGRGSRRRARKARIVVAEKARHVQFGSGHQAEPPKRRKRPGRSRTGRRAERSGLPGWIPTPSSKAAGKAKAAQKVPNAIGIDRLLRDVQTGRFEQMMSALTAAGAAITAVEIFTEHDGASFGNKMMWWPIVIVPTAVPIGIASVVSKRVAKTALPVVSAMILLNGLQGTFFHWRGIAQKPGGLKNFRYNIEMGPPVFAPLLSSLVGGMGLLAAVLRREGE